MPSMPAPNFEPSRPKAAVPDGRAMGSLRLIALATPWATYKDTLSLYSSFVILFGATVPRFISFGASVLPLLLMRSRGLALKRFRSGILCQEALHVSHPCLAPRESAR